jgi:hypothetical protein
MNNVLIRVTGHQRNGISETQFDVYGKVCSNTGDGADVEFTAEGIDFTAKPSDINAAIIAAGIAAIEADETIVIGHTDAVTLLGGAVKV